MRKIKEASTNQLLPIVSTTKVVQTELAEPDCLIIGIKSGPLWTLTDGM